MTIRTPAGAFAAVATLVLGADRLGTEEEKTFIFGRMCDLDVFRGLDEGAFAKLIEEATGEVYASFPSDAGRITDEGVARLLEIVCATLSTDQRAEAFRTAVELARADGMVLEEQHLLERLGEGLEMDPATARRMIAREA